MAGEGDFEWRSFKFTITTSIQQVLPANPQRLAALFSTTSTVSPITVQTSQASAGAPGFLVPTSGYLEFTFSRHGPLPSSEWWALSSGSTPTLFVTEIIVSSGRDAP